jgi:branched-chain amino acid transport system substrate-binding protein
MGDTQGDAEKAIEEYSRLITSEGASVVLGPMLVRCTEAVATASKTHGVPFISFTKRREIPELGTSVFRLGATVNNQVSELVSYASEYLGVKTFTIVYPDTPGGREFALDFRQEVSAQRGLILGLVDYQPSDESSLDRAADEIASRPTQAVFMPDTLDRVWALSEKLRELEVKTPIMLGPALWDDAVAIRGYGAALNGSVYVTPFYARSSQGPVVAFRNSYEAKHDRPPELLGAQAFDAAELVFQAAISTDGTPASIANALKTESGVRGVTGVLRVAPSGEIERRMSVLRLKDGESLEVMSAGDIVGHYPEEHGIESEPTGDLS